MSELSLSDAEVVVVEGHSLQIVVAKRQLLQFRQFETGNPRRQGGNTVLMQIDSENKNVAAKSYC